MKLFFVSIFITLSFIGFSQETIKWNPSFETVQQISKETGKPMIIFFSGSDWCKPCIKLKKYILETEEFAKYADKFVSYNADFPYRVKQSKELKKQNEALAELYNKKGEFPKVVFVNTDGKVMGSTGFMDCSIAEYIEKIEKLIN